MQTETTMGAAMTRAGYSANVEALRIAFAKFRNNGGTFVIALSHLKDAYEMPDEGRNTSASNGRLVNANVRQPNGDDEATGAVQEGQTRIAPSSPPQRDAGAIVLTPLGRPTPAPTSRPVREPNAVERLAAAKARNMAALTIMDTMTVKGRGAWTRIAIGELRAIMVEGTRDAAIARQIMRDVPIATPTTATVGEIISLKSFQRAVQKAAEVVDVEIGHVEA